MVKSYYELLSVGAEAAAEDIKAAFRREIARYHPDKVAHLGPEFLQIAEARAADLTEAYRILMDPTARALYDEQLRAAVVPDAQVPPPPAAADAASPTGTAAGTAAADAAPHPETAAPGAPFNQERATRDEFLKRAAVARFCDAVAAALDHAEEIPARGFDAGYVARPKRALLGHQDPPVRLLARFVPTVDTAAVEETWALALRAAGISGDLPAVFLMGSGLAGARELAACIADLKRRHVRHPSAPPLLVPVDVRDWSALVPTEAPSPVRHILKRLQNRS